MALFKVTLSLSFSFANRSELLLLLLLLLLLFFSFFFSGLVLTATRHGILRKQNLNSPSAENPEPANLLLL